MTDGSGVVRLTRSHRSRKQQVARKRSGPPAGGSRWPMGVRDGERGRRLTGGIRSMFALRNLQRQERGSSGDRTHRTCLPDAVGSRLCKASAMPLGLCAPSSRHNRPPVKVLHFRSRACPERDRPIVLQERLSCICKFRPAAAKCRYHT
jgi:hypothetical protein